MTVKENLLAAATLIRERGWCQNEGNNADGACCLVRALGEAEAALGAHVTRGVTIRSCYHLRVNHQIRDAVQWNDEPGRTKEEVLALLERAAESAE